VLTFIKQQKKPEEQKMRVKAIPTDSNLKERKQLDIVFLQAKPQKRFREKYLARYSA